MSQKKATETAEKKEEPGVELEEKRIAAIDTMLEAWAACAKAEAALKKAAKAEAALKKAEQAAREAGKNNG